MAAVCENFGLHNRYKPVFLADGSIASEGVSGLLDGQVGGLSHCSINLQHRPPLGEPCPCLVVLCAPLAESVQTLSCRLSIGQRQRHDSLVHLDAGQDALCLQKLHHRLPGGCLLVERLFEEDAPRDVLSHAFGLEQELSVGSSVWLSVFHPDVVEPFLDRACRLISRENSLPRDRDLSRVLCELLRKLLVNFHHVEELKKIRIEVQVRSEGSVETQ
mmetsp:Transcript_14437/g.29071  ORF Transcript_14437/g.29071 Transcript_14437/m.29071 type:complete len:217 (-) Transcript_14437:118-768(-)